MATELTSDLLSWLQLFWNNDSVLTYESISDAYFLNEVFREINHNAAVNQPLTSIDSMMDKVKNWEILIKNIGIYYAEVLQQVIVVKLPSIGTVCRQHNSQKFQEEIDKAIFLILGAAVQCERKQYFIQDIVERLPDKSIQHGLMELIKKITENNDIVVNYSNICQLSTEDIMRHLRNILEHRQENFFEDNRNLLSEIEDLHWQLDNHDTRLHCLRRISLENGNVNVQSKKGIEGELTDFKGRLRKFQDELDEKTNIIDDLQHELDLQQDENNRLKDVQIKLKNESRRARQLQDELDSCKEAAIKLQTVESKNVKLKEKVKEFDYYKTRCDELREDLSLLSNENTHLLEKLDGHKKLIEHSTKVESEKRKAIQRIEELDKICSDQNIEISKLEETLQSLQKNDLSSNLDKITYMDDEPEYCPITVSIADQVLERTNEQLMRLEIENRSLNEKLLENNEIEILQKKFTELEEENMGIVEKLLKLEEVLKMEQQKSLQAGESHHQILREKKQLELIMEANKDIESQLIRDNKSLSESVLIIHEKLEKFNYVRFDELEKENLMFHTSVNELNHTISSLEFDIQMSVQKCNRLDQSLIKSQQDNISLSKQNDDLSKEILSLGQLKLRMYNDEKELSEKYFEKNEKYKGLQPPLEEQLTLKLIQDNYIPNSTEVPLYTQCPMELKNEIVKLELNNARLESEKQLVILQCQNLTEKLRTLQDNHNSLRTDNANLSNQITIQENIGSQLTESKAENLKMNDECNDLTRKLYKLELELTDIRRENQLLNTEQNQHKKVIFKLKETNSDVLKKANELEKEMLKLESRIECLITQNEQLKTENNRMKSIFEQKHELLTETLSYKKSQSTEENSLRDHLQEAQRNKERLEGEIMKNDEIILSDKGSKENKRKLSKTSNSKLKMQNLLNAEEEGIKNNTTSMRSVRGHDSESSTILESPLTSTSNRDELITNVASEQSHSFEDNNVKPSAPAKRHKKKSDKEFKALSDEPLNVPHVMEANDIVKDNSRPKSAIESYTQHSRRVPIMISNVGNSMYSSDARPQEETATRTPKETAGIVEESVQSSDYSRKPHNIVRQHSNTGSKDVFQRSGTKERRSIPNEEDLRASLRVHKVSNNKLDAQNLPGRTSNSYNHTKLRTSQSMRVTTQSYRSSPRKIFLVPQRSAISESAAATDMDNAQHTRKECGPKKPFNDYTYI